MIMTTYKALQTAPGRSAHIRVQAQVLRKNSNSVSVDMIFARVNYDSRPGGHHEIRFLSIFKEHPLRTSGNDKRTEQILQAVMDAVICTDEFGKIHSCNPSAELMFGWKCSDVCGKNVTMLLDPSLAGRTEYVDTSPANRNRMLSLFVMFFVISTMQHIDPETA